MNGPQNLAREVKLARIGAGFERANAFAESLGLTPKTISNIETAARESYSTVTLLKLDVALGWEMGTSRSLLSGEIETPVAKRPAQQDRNEIRVSRNDCDEQLEIEAPDIQINIASDLVQLEATYWDRFNWGDVSPEELVEAGYRARAEFMAALDEIKVKSLKVSTGHGVVPVHESRMDEVREELIRAEAAEGWTEEDQP